MPKGPGTRPGPLREVSSQLLSSGRRRQRSSSRSTSDERRCLVRRLAVPPTARHRLTRRHVPRSATPPRRIIRRRSPSSVRCARRPRGRCRRRTRRPRRSGSRGSRAHTSTRRVERDRTADDSHRGVDCAAMSLDNSSAIVTGGASGMGAATARRLAAEGAHVVVLDRDSGKGEALTVQVQATAVP